jgi:hypothetical protein
MMAESWNSGTRRVTVARQQQGKHVSTSTHNDVTIEDVMFSICSTQRNQRRSGTDTLVQQITIKSCVPTAV